MFNRMVLKERAKKVLSKSYWSIFTAILICNAVSSLASGIVSIITGGGMTVSTLTLNPALFISFQVVTLALSVAVSALLTMPLQVGFNKYVLELSDGESNLSTLLYSFRTNYVGISTVVFLKQLIITVLTAVPLFLILIGANILIYSESLWTLAIILLGYVAMIPLFIKTYDYYLVEYILTDKPGLTWKEALGESKLLMRGNRFKTFVLNLSFIGWVLLGTLLCFIGIIFVTPYIQATNAQLYKELSGKNNITNNPEGE